MLSSDSLVNPTFTPDLSGTYVAQLIVHDGTVESDPDTVTITVPDTTPPTPADLGKITVGPITNGQVTLTGNAGSVEGNAQVIITNTRTSASVMVTANADGSFTAQLGAQIGDQLSIVVTDSAGNSSTPSTLTITPAAPLTVSVAASAPSGEAPFAVTLTASVSQPSGVTVTWEFGDGATATGSLTQTHTYTTPGTYTATVTVTSGAENVQASTPLKVEAAIGSLPPDPVTVAPPLNLTVVTDIFSATEFLYTGANPIQTGVAAGTLEPRRVAVLRGQVKTRDDQPLSGVTIAVLSHPEFGQTLTRADGMFDLVVNGGGPLTLTYRKAGYLPAQRQVEAPWREYAFADEVILIAYDPLVTTIDLTAPTPMQVARGSVSTDANGSRQATILFPQGTQAQMMLPDGSMQPLSTLHVRATEYTIGVRGPDTMPAVLPPTSGYTYAVELSVDEALVNGKKIAGKDVLLSQPVIVYVENFLDIPTGGVVPVGYYDNDQGTWVPWDNGQIIKIVGVTNGLADLDTDGNGSADDTATLTALGITDAERSQVAALYTNGQSLWRMTLTHFSTWDHNWPYGPPGGGGSPGGGGPDGDNGEDDPCEEEGSIIRCENRTLGERLPIVGTPWALHYESGRVPGHRAQVTIPLSGSTLSGPLIGIELEVNVAGQRFQQTYPALPNQSTTFVWNGKDAYGRPIQGEQIVGIRISNVYDAMLLNPVTRGRAFVRTSGQPLSSNLPRGEALISLQWRIPLATTTTDMREYGLGGWGVNGHHIYDPNGRALQQGDGRRRTPRSLSPIITRIAGTSNYGAGLDTTLAINSHLNLPTGVVVSPDGSLYIADAANNRIRRVKPDGTIVTVAGTDPIPPPPTNELHAQRSLRQTAQAVTEALKELTQARTSAGRAALLADDDGGPATAAQLANPQAVALGPDGSLYIADTDHHRIRRVSLTGIISTVAGTGGAGFSGDEGPATEAEIARPLSLAVDVQGAVYIADTDNHRIRRVGPDGIIYTIAGDGTASFGGDGGPATEAQLFFPAEVAVGTSGDVYIADTANNRVRRVNISGVINTVAGTGSLGFNGDGILAIEATLSSPRGLGLGRDGTLYIADEGNGRIRHLAGDGQIATVAGGGEVGVPIEGSPATASILSSPAAVALGPEGAIYIANTFAHRILRVAPPLPGFSVDEISLASEDGSEVDVFDQAGRHLRTINTLTGTVQTQFGYDSAGRLTQITDGDGNITIIERNAQGAPVAIISPYGQHTTLALNSDGYLTAVTTPANETTSFTYTPTGLMTGMTTSRGHVYQYTYGSDGRLLRDTDPAGGFTALARSGNTSNYEVTKTTAAGRVKRYQVERRGDDTRRRSAIAADGTERTVVIGQDGTRTRTGADGTVTISQQSPDPRFGMLAPLGRSSTVTTPGGLTSTMTTERTTTLSDPSNIFSLTQQTDLTTRNGRTSTSVYEAATRTTTTTSPAGRQAITTTDAQGRVVQQEATGLAPFQLSYDTRGRVSGLGQGGRSSTFTYDANGYLASTTDPLLRTTSYTRDAVGRPLTQTLPDGRVITFSYDANGNLTSLTPPSRPAHDFTFTPVDLLQDYLPPQPQPPLPDPRTLYSYNLDRQLTNITRPDGQTIALNYDAAGRLSSQVFPDPRTLTPVTLSYSYDSAGRVQSRSASSGGNIAYEYDGSLLTAATTTGPVPGNVTWTYDPDLRVDSQSLNGSYTVPFTYDADSLLTSAGDLTLSRDIQNGLLTGTTLGSVEDTIAYNLFAEPTDYQATVNSLPVFHQTYTRDNLGRITQKTETINGVTDTYGYTYDLTGRLTEVTLNSLILATYIYDPNGNRLSKTGPSGTTTYTHDAQDRLLTQSPVSGPPSVSYTYTANGELSSKTVSGLPSPVSYSYDVLGNLLAATLSDGTQIEYVIDGQNRRVGKKVNGTPVQGFVYQNQLQPVAELDGSGNIVSRFVYASKANVPDYMVKNGTTYRIISDHLGSPRLVIDTSTNAIVQRLDYDEFGQVITDTNPGFQPFGFAGGLYDRDTKLVRFGARDYDPEVGRWTAKDPILFAGGDTNLYGYVLNDPVNLVDPSGLIGVAQLAIRLLRSLAGIGTLAAIIESVMEGQQCLGGCPVNPGEDQLREQELTRQEIEDIQKDLDEIKEHMKRLCKEYGVFCEPAEECPL